MPRCVLLTLLALSCEAPAFAAEPTVADCLSASNESARLRLEHKLRQARDLLRTCVSDSCPAEIRAECTRRMDQVAMAIPSIVFAVRDGRDQRELSAVKVSMDGEVVADRLDGSAIDLDPGEHSFTFEAAGRPPLTATIVVHEGDKNRAEVVVLPATPPKEVEGQTRPLAGTRAEAGAAREPVVAASGQEGRAMRTWGFVSGGLGAAELVVGGVFGGMAFGAWGQADKLCPSHVDCSEQALGKRHDAVVFSTVSDVGFIAGGALAALGVSLILLAPKGTTSPVVAARAEPGWLGLRGWFR
jgi:hypothetical protein